MRAIVNLRTEPRLREEFEYTHIVNSTVLIDHRTGLRRRLGGDAQAHGAGRRAPRRDGRLHEARERRQAPRPLRAGSRQLRGPGRREPDRGRRDADRVGIDRVHADDRRELGRHGGDLWAGCADPREGDVVGGRDLGRVGDGRGAVDGPADRRKEQDGVPADGRRVARHGARADVCVHGRGGRQRHGRDRPEPHGGERPRGPGQRGDADGRAGAGRVAATCSVGGRLGPQGARASCPPAASTPGSRNRRPAAPTRKSRTAPPTPRPRSAPSTRAQPESGSPPRSRNSSALRARSPPPPPRRAKAARSPRAS